MLKTLKLIYYFLEYLCSRITQPPPYPYMTYTNHRFVYNNRYLFHIFNLLNPIQVEYNQYMCVCLKEHVSHNWIYRYLATLLLNTTESAYIVYDIMKLTPTHQKFLFDVYAKYLTIRSTPQCDTVHICEQYALEQQPSLMDPHYLDLQLHKLSTTVYYSKEDAITARIFADFLEYLHERSSKLDECA